MKDRLQLVATAPSNHTQLVAISSVVVLARFEIFSTGFGPVASKKGEKKNQTGLDFKTLTSIVETAVAGNHGGDHPVLLLLTVMIRLAVPNIERDIQMWGACSISNGRYPSWATVTIMSNSGSYPVTLVTSQHSSPTPVTVAQITLH